MTRGANAPGNNSIAIGANVTAGSDEADNAIAIGTGASATHANSVAIGTGAVSIDDNVITLGNESTTVYIPGNLVVAGSTFVADAIWAGTVFMDENTAGTGKTVDGSEFRRLTTYNAAVVNKNIKNYASNKG